MPFVEFPWRRSSPIKNVTTELFGRNKFVPLMQNNQIVTQGYYEAIRSFADAVEGRDRSVAHSLETFIDTYTLIDSIRSIIKKSYL